MADTHGQFRFNYRHPHIPAGMESELLVRAFQRDFSVNGPSMVRVVRTTLAGWRRYKSHPDERIRRRFAWEVKEIPTTYSAVVAAVRRYYRTDPAMHAALTGLLQEIHGAFGWRSRLYSALGGPYVLWKIRQEGKRLARGWSYEPPTFYEINHAVDPADHPSAQQSRYVTPRVVLPHRACGGVADVEQGTPAETRTNASRAGGSEITPPPVRDLGEPCGSSPYPGK